MNGTILRKKTMMSWSTRFATMSHPWCCMLWFLLWSWPSFTWTFSWKYYVNIVTSSSTVLQDGQRPRKGHTMNGRLWQFFQSCCWCSSFVGSHSLPSVSSITWEVAFTTFPVSSNMYLFTWGSSPQFLIHVYMFLVNETSVRRYAFPNKNWWLGFVPPRFIPPWRQLPCRLLFVVQDYFARLYNCTYKPYNQHGWNCSGLILWTKILVRYLDSLASIRYMYHNKPTVPLLPSRGAVHTSVRPLSSSKEGKGAGGGLTKGRAIIGRRRHIQLQLPLPINNKYNRKKPKNPPSRISLSLFIQMFFH